MNETSMSMNFFEIFSCHMSKAKWLFFNCIWYTISLKIKESTINKELLFTSSYFMQRVKRWPQKQPCRKLCVAFDMYWNWMFFFLLLHTLTFTLNSFMECAKKSAIQCMNGTTVWHNVLLKYRAFQRNFFPFHANEELFKYLLLHPTYFVWRMNVRWKLSWTPLHIWFSN